MENKYADLSFDERKKVLLDEKDKIQEELNTDFKELKSNAVHYGKYALLAGGAVLTVYVIASLIFPSKKKRKKVFYVPGEGGEKGLISLKEDDRQPAIVRMILSSISTFLLSLAKERLMKIVEDFKTRHDEVGDSKLAAK